MDTSVMVTPPGADGKVNPAILAAASVAGVDRIFKVGGAQAIAALAYGTESVPRVDKIVGPGNAFVAEAKKQVFGKVAIDMQGTNLELYRRLSSVYPIQLIASGGVSSLEDVRRLAAMGLYGAVIGKACYTGAVDLREAIGVAG